MERQLIVVEVSGYVLTLIGISVAFGSLLYRSEINKKIKKAAENGEDIEPPAAYYLADYHLHVSLAMFMVGVASLVLLAIPDLLLGTFF